MTKMVAQASAVLQLAAAHCKNLKCSDKPVYPAWLFKKKISHQPVFHSRCCWSAAVLNSSVQGAPIITCGVGEQLGISGEEDWEELFHLGDSIMSNFSKR